MRTVITNRKSHWREVTSGVPQGSVLAPIMFAIYINDMTEGITSYISMFADDAKLLREITKEEDCIALNKDWKELVNGHTDGKWNSMQKSVVCLNLVRVGEE